MSLNLTAAGLADHKAWEAAGYALPSYDREAMITRTKESPCWVHFGAGNIFRAFQANTAQELLNNGTFDRGVIVAEGFDTEIIRDMYQPHDNLSILVTLKADGSVEKTVVGSIAESLAADTADSPDFARLKEIFTKDSLQMATFTITEKGYSLKNGAGELLPAVAADFAAGPSSVTSYMGKVASFLYERFLAGEKPVAMVSTDNCSHNGEKLSLALTAYASAWEENKLVQPGFLSYLQNPEKVSFPWTMIDKITPRPDGSIEKILEENGLADAQSIVTSRHTYVAPFVNAEECQYLVVEDHFPNGRPPMEKSGWIFTDRETVNKTERMKVCTCLNPLHTALAVFGCLLDYELISEEMKNPVLKKLVERIGYSRGKSADGPVSDKYNPRAKKADSADNLRRNPGCVIILDIVKTVFGDNHNQGRSQGDNRMGPDSRLLVPVFPLISNYKPASRGRQNAQKKLRHRRKFLLCHVMILPLF